MYPNPERALDYTLGEAALSLLLAAALAMVPIGVTLLDAMH